MPVYEYECSCGELFCALRPMSAYQEPHVCPACGAHAQRALLTAPAFAGMPEAMRTAHAINEKARHEPKTSAEHAARHGPGCGCCGGGLGKSRTVTAEGGAKAFPTARPWMISH